MAYMTVLKKTESQLRLLREPTFLSKAVFFGFIFGVAGVILFGSESFLFKVLIGFCAIFLSCFMVDNYEICDVNKVTSEVRLSRLHLCQYFLSSVFSPRPYVTCQIADIQDVRIENQDVDNAEKSYRVVLVLNSGVHLGVTEVFTNNSLSEHEKIAEAIVSFLDVKSPLSNVEDDVEYEGDGSSSEDDDVDDDDDDFEQISKADIEEMEEEHGKMTEHGDSVENADKPDEQVVVEETQPANETETGELQSGDGNTAVVNQ